MEKVKTISPTAFYEARYHHFFSHVARFVAKRGGTLTHAEDLYHDALILYYEKITTPGFVVKISEEAYIMGIVKNLWVHTIKGELTSDALTDNNDSNESKAFEIDHERLYTVVLSAGKKCLDLLNLFYQQKLSLMDVASKLGFGSEHSASVQKYKCLEKIREIVKQNSLCHEDFFE